MNSGPVAQFSPIDSGARCSTDVAKASTACPASIVPMGSMVALSIRGTLAPASRMACRTPRPAAFTFRVSCDVSRRIASTPPSISAAACRA